MRASLQMCLLALASALLLTACGDGSKDRSNPAGEGYAGLGRSVSDDSVGDQGSDFAQPVRGQTLSFPDDFGPHPQHRIEWWYLTANLVTKSGEPLGLQWTQFRQAIQPRHPDQAAPDASQWPLESVYMAHAALSFAGEHHFEEKLARGDIGQAGAVAEPFEVWLDDWRLMPKTPDSEPDRGWLLSVNTDDWGYELHITQTESIVAHGEGGFSAKAADGQGSMYFSLVDLQIRGEVRIGDKRYSVSGIGWFDREWSSQFLKADQLGWDWFALHFNSGEKLMAFRLRQDDEHFYSGTWISTRQAPWHNDASGIAAVEIQADRTQALSPGQLQIEVIRSDDEGQAVPTQFRLRIPDKNVDLQVIGPEGRYWNDGLFPYWESPVRVSGSHEGVGYMELTGYE